MKNYVNLRNNIPSTYNKGGRDGRKHLPDTFTCSPLSKFSGIETNPNLSNFHPFGCPVYVLDTKLQAGQSFNKWNDRTRVGIFLCHSPDHSSTVPLVLNTTTANVSPQFHCLYDDAFSTCRTDAKFRSVWQIKARIKPAAPSIIDLIDNNVTLPPTISAPMSPHVPLPVIFEHPWDKTSPDPLPSVSVNIPISNTTPSSVALPPPPKSPSPSPSPPNVPTRPPSPVPPVTTRSGRSIRPPSRFDDTAHSSIHAYAATFSPPSSHLHVVFFSLRTLHILNPTLWL